MWHCGAWRCCRCCWMCWRCCHHTHVVLATVMGSSLHTPGQGPGPDLMGHHTATVSAGDLQVCAGGRLQRGGRGAGGVGAFTPHGPAPPAAAGGVTQAHGMAWRPVLPGLASLCGRSSPASVLVTLPVGQKTQIGRAPSNMLQRPMVLAPTAPAPTAAAAAALSAAGGGVGALRP